MTYENQGLSTNLLCEFGPTKCKAEGGGGGEGGRGGGMGQAKHPVNILNVEPW